MSGLLKIPKFTLKLPASLAKYGRTMSESPLELSFSLCEDNVCLKTKNEELRSPLKVNLPTAGNMEQDHPKTENHETEKADEEKSEKVDNMEVTCSVSVDGQEKQEFSFTLYDFDTKDKGNKQDMEKIVVRSICEALGKSLKLPPSGSRTIKVKLAISPDGSKDIDTIGPDNETRWPVEVPDLSECLKNQGYDSSKSANTASTYLMSSATEKTRRNYIRYNNDLTSSPLVSNVPVHDLKMTPSAKMKSMRHNHLISLQHQELKSGLKEHHKKTVNENVPDNRMTQNEPATTTFEDFHAIPCQPSNSRDHVPESRERRNHYLDLAGVESEPKPLENTSHQRHFVPTFLDPNYICPYRILDRTHVCSKAHRNREFPFSPTKKQSILCHPKVNAGAPEMTYKMHIDPNMKDDLLNLNFDLCDIMPNVKFDWEKFQHRRSKSYDLHESNFHNAASPKMKVKQSANFSADNQKNMSHLNSTPIHHYRFRNRDREKQRAMQQVASWITREHSANKDENETHFMCGGVTAKTQQITTTSNEKCEHHHLHEHVHHHYHHFAEF